MEPTSGIAVFSHLLNIKDKLFPQNKEIETSTDDNKNNDKYCSIIVEHSYNPGNLGDHELESIDLILAKRSQFTIPIRHIDWRFSGSKLDRINPTNIELEDLLLIGENGCLINMNLGDILSKHIEYLNLKNTKLKHALNSLKIQCVYADGYIQKVNAPESLKISLYNYYKYSKAGINSVEINSV
ncbi:MAG: hypothetical protein OQL06_00845 [Gammaproteobacteria bacterium]|nr:hypothetical protein [Gammaproteobacteria bacterium]